MLKMEWGVPRSLVGVYKFEMNQLSLVSWDLYMYVCMYVCLYNFMKDLHRI